MIVAARTATTFGAEQVEFVAARPYTAKLPKGRTQADRSTRPRRESQLSPWSKS
jgi:hypothetical protein